MIRQALILGTALALSACGSSQPGIDQTGARPDLPDQRETLIPPIRIASPSTLR